MCDGKWMYIKTAPRDGTCVLIIDGDTEIPVVAFHQHGQWLVRWDHEEFKGPTYWFPLPDPPSVVNADNKP